MKTLITLLTLFILSSCNFNSTYQNRENDKIDAEKITHKFYYSQTYGNKNDALNLFSEKFFAVTNRDKLNEMISSSENDFGKITEYNLKNWETLIVKGSNPKSEYLLTYDVRREKEPTQETFSMIKENGIIKIIGYRITKLY
ncbi:hypothetical protein H1R16_03255 [Marnyiella aurantia]|uniref:DUF4019 domain-containing protein n=1 Tax=Marnyiella aurantia TaxID=2758037 RepID=A0A7D7LQG9_9FLAO|nr:hypothetical protein [Marnyiella aurantia]MBA5245547.1 hypothetical protein [Marnyiella aurantia]QMS99040.1 hypothetical protein H1R16_03255 [Marnyiella aurantia]